MKRNHDKEKDSLWSIIIPKIIDQEHIYFPYMDMEVGQDRVILDISNDGAKTFRRIAFDSLNNRGGIWDFVMYNNQIGALLGGDFLLITKDQWNTYKCIDLEGIYYKLWRPMFFLDSSNLVLYWINEARKLNLDDYTVEEYYKPEPQLPGEDEKIVYGIYFENDTLGWASGGQTYGSGELKKDIIWKTTDRGKHWAVKHEYKQGESFGISRIVMNGKNGMAVGGWGIIIETNDGGETWNYIESSYEHQHSIFYKIEYAGSYPILATNLGGIQRLENDTRSEEENGGFAAQVYPNPASDQVTVALTKELGGEAVITISDMQGRPLLTHRTRDFMPEIDISSLNSGIYAVSIHTGNAVITKKLSVAK
jgi:hypothetical protein